MSYLLIHLQFKLKKNIVDCREAEQVRFEQPFTRENRGPPWRRAAKKLRISFKVAPKSDHFDHKKET